MHLKVNISTIIASVCAKIFINEYGEQIKVNTIQTQLIYI